MQSIPASLLPAGPQLDVPATVTPEQLEVLLNGLLQAEEKLPYSFYLDDQVRTKASHSQQIDETWTMITANYTQHVKSIVKR
jgi:hypothetical protein